MHNRLPQHTTPGLLEFYTETRDRYKRDKGTVKPTILVPTAKDIQRLARKR
jgi:hypothetical protein